MIKAVLSLAIGVCLSAKSAKSYEGSEVVGKDAMVINLAGKQRMLTQKMSKEALLIARGIDVDKNRRNLMETVSLFDKIINGLYHGDRELKLKKTTDKRILKQLDLISNLWKSFKIDVIKVASGDVDMVTLEAIANRNMPLLKNINSVVQMYQDSSNIEPDPEIAKTINLAGKQRMLTQKMTKELLLVANQVKADDNKKSLMSSGELFQETLVNFFNNSREDSLKDIEIAKRLVNVRTLWDRYQNLLKNSDFSEESRRELKVQREKISDEMQRDLLFIANRVDAMAYKNNLKRSGEIFDKTLNALIYGDTTLGLKRTEDKEILKQLYKVRDLWAQYKDIVFNADTSDESLKRAMDINMPLMKSMDRVVMMYEKRTK